MPRMVRVIVAALGSIERKYFCHVEPNSTLAADRRAVGESDTFPKKNTLLMFVVWLPMGSIRRRKTGLGRANLSEWKSTHQAASYVERSLQNPSRPDFSIHPNPSEESKTSSNHPRYAKIIQNHHKKNTFFITQKPHKKNGHPSFTRWNHPARTEANGGTTTEAMASSGYDVYIAMV